MKNLHIIKKYFQVTKANKKFTFLLILTSLLSNGPYLFTSLLFSLTINYLSKHNQQMVIVSMIIYFVLKILSKVFKILSYQVEKKLYNDVYQKLHHEIVCKLDTIELTYFSNHSNGEVLNIVNGDIKLLAEFGTWLSNAILLFISFLVAIVILSKISLSLMIFGCLINGIVIYLLNIYNDKFEVLTREGKVKADDEMQFYSELLSGIKDIKLFNILDKLHLKYQTLNASYQHIHDQQINNKIISNIISPSITMATEIILMIYACYNCLNGHFGIDTVLIIQSYFGTLFSSLSDLIATLGELRIKNVSIERYHDFICANDYNEPLDPQEFDPTDYQINIKHLHFAYGENQIFTDYNLEISPNTLNAVIGTSGSGKSTLFNLLLRFKKAKSGQIMIGNHLIENYPKAQYAKAITCVSQMPYLFHLSIYDNFALIDPDFNKIRQACQKAEIDDYIMSLPKQYDTIIEAGSLNLSGGQKQRLALARALLKDAKIILLDEITSALDETTSLEIFKTLTKLTDNHTIIMISHKPNEYNRCQNIIDLSN